MTKSKNRGLIIGIVVAAAVVLLAIAGAVYYIPHGGTILDIAR